MLHPSFWCEITIADGQKNLSPSCIMLLDSNNSRAAGFNRLIGARKARKVGPDGRDYVLAKCRCIVATWKRQRFLVLFLCNTLQYRSFAGLWSRPGSCESVFHSFRSTDIADRSEWNFRRGRSQLNSGHVHRRKSELIYLLHFHSYLSASLYLVYLTPCERAPFDPTRD